MAQGGEQGSVSAYVGEVVFAKRRGFLASTNVASVVVGVLTATLLGALLTTIFTKEEMLTWGWRIPFTIAAVFDCSLCLRRSLAEPEVYQELKAEEATSVDSAAPARSRTFFMVVRAIIVSGATSVFGYQWSITAPTLAITFPKVNPAAAMWAGVGANVVYLLALLLAGRLSDRFGRRPNIVRRPGADSGLSLPGLLSSSAWSLLLAASIANFVLALNTGTQLP